jgi:DNA ligase-1
MHRFAALFDQLDASTGVHAKVAALRQYLAEAAPSDAAWAVYFLAGGKPRRVLPTSTLRRLACELAGIDDWLFEECYQAAGDLAETIAQLLPPPRRRSDLGLAEWVEQRLLGWRDLDAPAQTEALRHAFDELDTLGRFLLIKLIGGGFRVGVSRLLVQRALADHAGIDAKRVAERMMGYTDARARPDAAAYLALVAPEGPAVRGGQPYPFFLAHPLQAEAESLGAVGDWLVEWKYDGIRAQLVRRDGQVWIWSRGEELVTESFPEVAALARALPDGCVLDGELLAWDAPNARPAAFAQLQRRINRKQPGRRLLQDVPVRMLAFDLLEVDDEDLRAWPQHQRRLRLQGLLQHGVTAGLAPSPLVEAAEWHALAQLRLQARERGVEGLMLKHRDSRYGSGRTRSDGLWWKWKIDPLTVDCVLIYAQAGHGRRANVYTDYTFAVWSRPPASADEAQAVVDAIARREPAQPGALQLVPFAKAYSGLTDEEFARVSRIVRETTLEKFGPVRSVRPTLVFELAFEGVQASKRHKSGVAVRFPRMVRIRDDKALWQADGLEGLQRLARSMATSTHEAR